MNIDNGNKINEKRFGIQFIDENDNPFSIIGNIENGYIVQVPKKPMITSFKIRLDAINKPMLFDILIEIEDKSQSFMVDAYRSMEINKLFPDFKNSLIFVHAHLKMPELESYESTILSDQYIRIDVYEYVQISNNGKIINEYQDTHVARIWFKFENAQPQYNTGKPK